MKHTPVKEVDILQPNTYEAVVVSATEKVSQNGNEMIELLLRVYGPEGATIPVYDYLVSSESSAWKIRHFCKSAGLDYEKGELSAEECIDRNVRADVIIKHDKSGQYPDRNAIKDYAERNGSAKPLDADSDIPF